MENVKNVGEREMQLVISWCGLKTTVQMLGRTKLFGNLTLLVCLHLLFFLNINVFTSDR